MTTPTYDEALQAANCLAQDFDLLMSGDWEPDEDSCQASLEMVERVRAYLLANKPKTI